MLAKSLIYMVISWASALFAQELLEIRRLNAIPGLMGCGKPVGNRVAFGGEAVKNVWIVAILK